MNVSFTYSVSLGKKELGVNFDMGIGENDGQEGGLNSNHAQNLKNENFQDSKKMPKPGLEPERFRFCAVSNFRRKCNNLF